MFQQRVFTVRTQAGMHRQQVCETSIVIFKDTHMCDRVDSRTYPLKSTNEITSGRRYKTFYIDL